MNIPTLLGIAQVIVAVLLIISVLFQQRGSGMGALFGGEGGVYRTKRGAERVLFWATIVLVILFFAISFVQLLV